MVRRGRFGLVLVLGLVLGSSSPAWAEEAEGETRPAYKLTPKKDPKVEHGKLSVLKGETRKDGDRFYLEFLNIRQPVAVTVYTHEKDADIALELSKFRWDQPDHKASTVGVGRATLKTRTEGELRISVASASEGIEYYVSVWVGDPVDPEMPPLVVKKSELGGSGGGSLSWLFAIGGILVVLIGGFVLWRKRKP